MKPQWMGLSVMSLTWGLGCSSEPEPASASTPQVSVSESTLSPTASVPPSAAEPSTAQSSTTGGNPTSSAPEGEPSTSVNPTAEPSGSAQSSGGAGGAPSVAAAAGAGGSSAPNGSAQGGAGPAPDPTAPGQVLPLSDGSRQFEDVVNLISAAGVAEVEALLRGERTDGLPASAQLFFQNYLDDYDFLVVLLDHEVPNATAAAAFDPVYRPAQRATGDSLPVDWRQSHTSERLRGVIGGVALGEPPLEHEFAHYWAMHLDPSLGFGTDRDQDYGSHWGMTSVYGQLGGFDEATLFCTLPDGARPPDCTPESNGRTRVRVGPFYPFVNRQVGYAPLELYLMGLLPVADVPERFWLLQDASYDELTVDEVTGEYLIEAGAVTEILFSDILALHGEVSLLPEEQRHYTAAVIVVSTEPVSDELLTNVSQWQAVFGNHAEPGTGLLRSFEERTGGRATLDTRLGRLRTPDDPVANPPAPNACSVTLQDCPEGLGCYGSMERQCAVPGTFVEGEPCEANTECQPGLACPNRLMACAPYCDPFDSTAEKACATLCPAGTVSLVDATDAVVGAYCVAE